MVPGVRVVGVNNLTMFVFEDYGRSGPLDWKAGGRYQQPAGHVMRGWEDSSAKRMRHYTRGFREEPRHEENV